jgi:hypothetical protein
MPRLASTAVGDRNYPHLAKNMTVLIAAFFNVQWIKTGAEPGTSRVVGPRRLLLRDTDESRCQDGERNWANDPELRDVGTQASGWKIAVAPVLGTSPRRA